MARAYSAEFKSTLAATGAPEAPLLLLQIDHPALPEPVRVIQDNQNLTSGGHEYPACDFRAELPDDFDGQASRARLAIDNIGKELMYWIETSSGGAGSSVTFSQVMRSRPDAVEWSVTMNLYNVTANAREVSAELGFDNPYARPAVQMVFSPDVAPGVF